MPAKPLTPEQKEDAAKLMQIFEKHKAKHGLTQALLADDLGYSVQSSVSQYLKGKIPLNVEAAMKFAKRFGCSVSDFSPSIQKEIDQIAVFASTNKDKIMNTTPDKDFLAAQVNAAKFQERMKIDSEALDLLFEFAAKHQAALKETQEVIEFLLLEEGKEPPGWVDSDARAHADSLQYKAHKWLTDCKRKTG